MRPVRSFRIRTDDRCEPVFSLKRMVTVCIMDCPQVNNERVPERPCGSCDRRRAYRGRQQGVWFRIGCIGLAETKLCRLWRLKAFCNPHRDQEAR
jgi:hypothetical protein